MQARLLPWWGLGPYKRAGPLSRMDSPKIHFMTTLIPQKFMSETQQTEHIHVLL